MDQNVKKHIIHLYELGLSASDVADITGITLEQLVYLCSGDVDIKAAKNTGIKRTNLKVIEALLKTAIGYKTDVITIEKRLAKDGTVVAKTETRSIKDVPPNLAAIKIWLDNKDSSEWKDSISEIEQKLNITVTVDAYRDWETDRKSVV